MNNARPPALVARSSEITCPNEKKSGRYSAVSSVRR